MKIESASHATERAKRATEPVYLVRFYHVPDYGRVESYPFSRDFASRPIREATMPELLCIERLGGGPAQIVPEQGRASIGGFQIDCTDLKGEILRYFANLQLTLPDAITAVYPGLGDPLRLSDVGGLPALGTVEVDTGDALERIRYSSRDEDAGVVIVSARGVDGTVAAAHAKGAVATNGEQIRPGQRVRLLSGYASQVEDEMMESQVVEVIDRNISDIIRASYSIETADITRALRREVFLTAKPAAPFFLGGHPMTIALWVMTSTGTGANGPYDVLAAENGLGIPHEFIDITGIELLRNEFPTDSYCFAITQPEVAKTWLEQEIFKTINAYPLVRQDGTLTLKLYTPVLT